MSLGADLGGSGAVGRDVVGDVGKETPSSPLGCCPCSRTPPVAMLQASVHITHSAGGGDDGGEGGSIVPDLDVPFGAHQFTDLSIVLA